MEEAARQRKKLPAHEAIIVLFDERDYSWQRLEALLKLLRLMHVPPGEKEWLVSELRRVLAESKTSGTGDWTPKFEEAIRAIQEE